MSVVITRSIELDAGHRVPDHGSKCRNAHGHRYRVEVAVTGHVISERGNAEDGMVIDFGRLQEALEVVVHDPADHGFIVASHDLEMREALLPLKTKTVVVNFPPTAERLAEWWGGDLADYLAGHGIRLVKLTVWETPKSSATWTPGR